MDISMPKMDGIDATRKPTEIHDQKAPTGSSAYVLRTRQFPIRKSPASQEIHWKLLKFILSD